jgi:hypothetical protein
MQYFGRMEHFSPSIISIIPMSKFSMLSFAVQFSLSCAEILRDAIAANRSLRVFDASDAGLSPAGVSALCGGIAAQGMVDDDGGDYGGVTVFCHVGYG